MLPLPVTITSKAPDGSTVRKMTWTQTSGWSEEDVHDAKVSVEATGRFRVESSEVQGVSFIAYVSPTTGPVLGEHIRRFFTGATNAVGGAVDTANAIQKAINPFDFFLNTLGLSVGGLVAIAVLVVLLGLYLFARARFG